jgi:hypothetical protein
MRRRRALVTFLALVAVAGIVIAIQRVSSGHHQPGGPPCVATAGTTSYPLDLEQAANATTIAAVGKRLGLPDHAVTIALAAALQESKLLNLPNGDLDSVGLFQQRPSQGWGTANQIIVPRYAATAFYSHLATVRGWETMSVTDAAQSVQRSAAPDAYAAWEPVARLLAQVFTGETSAGLTCRFRQNSGTANSGLAAAIAQELGSPSTGVSVQAARGWTVASWLVGHAQQYRIQSVAFAGQRWTPSQAAWKPGAPATSEVQFVAM